MTSRHKGKLEEGGHPSVKHLNVYGVDFLELLDERCMIVGIQDLRKGKDVITPKGDSDIGWLKHCQRAPELIDSGKVLSFTREMHNDFCRLHALLDA